MSGIHEVQETLYEFFSKELGKEREMVRFIKLSKSEDGWNGVAEVTEVNEYLKKIGYPTIFDRNIYQVDLDAELNVVGFAQTGSRERSYTTESREEL